ncbi:hypothetical protein Mapa_013642 [Marchantia paleacea]|nr:hypothetical protein Mapa_013642 [Marchantia paleacea]
MHTSKAAMQNTLAVRAFIVFHTRRERLRSHGSCPTLPNDSQEHFNDNQVSGFTHSASTQMKKNSSSILP